MKKVTRNTKNKRTCKSTRTQKRRLYYGGLEYNRSDITIEEGFTQDFIDGMYNNMWTFMNKDTMIYVLHLLGCQIPAMTHKKSTNDNDFRDSKFHHTICHKGSNKSGHYVYISVDPHNSSMMLGTYESGLLFDNDDGVCHGAAMIFACLDYGINLPLGGQLIIMPTTDEQVLHNYTIILNFYTVIIQTGVWDKALHKNFYYDVHWIPDTNTTTETQNALKFLAQGKQDILRLHSRLRLRSHRKLR